MKNNFLFMILLCSLLIGCGIDNNLVVTTNPGDCAAFNLGLNSESALIVESIPAPYCMAVTITNNGGGQNFVNSSNYPVSNLTMTISGANNINSPASSSAMNPNNCATNNNTIPAGGNCIFYLQISQESNAVSNMESVVITLNYSINNTLFGGSSTNSYSTPFTIYEVTNLYITQANGQVSFFNGSSIPFTTTWAESGSGGLNATAVDNSTFGYLYLGGNNGVYQYGDESITSSISPSGFAGVNNLISSGGNINMAATNKTGIYQWNISSNSWTNSGTSALFPFANNFNANVKTLSPSGNQYLALSNQVYGCANTSGSNTCNNEGVAITSATNVTSLGFMSAATNNTGLYAGTNVGLFVESGTLGSTSSSWSQVVYAGTPLTDQINAMTTDSSGNLYVGDNNGYIWLITSTSQSTISAAAKWNISSSPIQSMIVDSVANTLYYVVGSSGELPQLYSCNLGTPGTTPSCAPSTTPLATLINVSGNTFIGGTNVVGMNIGSQLNSTN